MPRTLRYPPLLAAAALVAALASSGSAQTLQLRPGDRVAIIGNTLADRMQHEGTFEALVQARFPGHRLVFRNLGFSGDEVDVRLRSAGFGSPDDWLTKVKAGVILAFFGANEAHVGREGVEAFRTKLDAMVKHHLAGRHDGDAAPRLVLFSPIAQEGPKGRDLPDPDAANERLKLYSVAIGEVARANNVGFVDLFPASLAMLAAPDRVLTINGIHLNDEGNRLLALAIDPLLLGTNPRPDPARLEKIRGAVLAKDFAWFNRYRTVDGYSIFGGRADLSFVGGQTNRVVAAREMEILDEMTANRDRAIWAAAEGKEAAVDDSNTAPFIPVVTNKPGPGPDGAHIFLGGEEAIGKMTPGKGLKVNLFASEENFPELTKPVQMSFDARGRLWVACWESYPHWKPRDRMDDKILILEDTDGDGKADKRTVFADGLHCPTGFEFANGGVLVAQAPDLMFLKDTDGDDRADARTRVLSGLDSADTHHASNSFQLDPGGALYFQEGTFHQTQVETPYGPPVRNSNAGVFRYEPKSQRFEVYVPYGFANPHGHAFDRWGQDVIVDGTGANPYHGTLFSGHLDYPNKHNAPPQVYQQRTRPCSGIEILSSRHFPAEFQGNLLVANVIGFQGILRYRLDEKESSLAGTELEPVVSSTDPNFRPADIEVGPDGAIYFLDWQNPIIGHMQHNLRDPSRDRKHGRVYRVTHEGRPLAPASKIAGATVDGLLELLKEPDDRVRYRAKVELGARATAEVVAALGPWVARLGKSDADYSHHLTEALWVHQYHDVVNLELLASVLASPDYHARAAATRVLCVWRDRVPDALDRLRGLAADPYSRVRLEAVRAASFFRAPEAVEVPLISAEQPDDPYIEYTRGETMRALEPTWRKAVAEGRPIAFRSDAGARFFLGLIGTPELLKMARTKAVDAELLRRPGVREEDRRAALADLARLENAPEIRILLGALGALDKEEGDRGDAAIYDLGRLLTERGPADQAAARRVLVPLAIEARRPAVRHVGFLALIAGEGVDRAWALAEKSPRSLRDLVDAVPMIRDPGERSALYPRILPLLEAKVDGPRGIEGRFVRIELKGRRTLTLAEVEVFSDGRNVAPGGKASQVNTAYGGPAERAIDGNKGPSYGDGGQTHTEEDTRDPWWEVDLGGELPIDSVAIYNRADGSLGQRLDRFVVRVLDSRRDTVFITPPQAAPRPMAAIAVGGLSPEAALRRSAMTALTTVRGREAETFKALAKVAKGGGPDRSPAIRALLRVPAPEWPAEEAGPLLDAVLAHVKTIPTRERTTPDALDALQLGDALAALLPPDRAASARRELGELGVRVIRIGTVTDQMLFDKDRIAAAAGKPVEVVFENGDIMPHNFVVARPGSLEEVGLLAESTATAPDAASRQYVPRSDKILVASRLLATRESQKISFTAPTKPGVYPYVCTYPGHWRRMYGAFYVVEDLPAYLADPEGYLASHPMPISDELLKGNRPRKEWTVDDLASAAESLDHGRSFANGRRMFEVASCVSCHKMNGVGAEVGPNLAQLDPKMSRVEVLRSLIEPSAKVDEKYQTHVIATRSGKVFTGMILEETPARIRLIENPLAKSEPVTIEKSDVEDRSKSATSIMPKGLLDKLSREEVLDLVAYILARGEAGSPLFRGQHAHGH